MKRALKILIVAGEHSGDVLAANLIPHLRKLIPDCEFLGVAGPKMREAGCESLCDMELLNVMGFHQVLLKMPTILSVKNKLISYCKIQKPDIFIGIDYTDFNLALAKKFKSMGIKTIQYKGPSVWAWRSGRIKTVQKAVDHLLTIFPFEQACYQNTSIQATYVGHYLADQVALKIDKKATKKQLGFLEDNPLIALLPGSRLQENDVLIEPFIQTALVLQKLDPSRQFAVAPVSQPMQEVWQKYFQPYQDQITIKILTEQSQTLLAASDLVMVASGTATLEAMLYKTPMVVAYRVSKLYEWLMKACLKIEHVSLPNIIAGYSLVDECLQKDMSVEQLTRSAIKILNQPNLSQSMKSIFLTMHQELQCNSIEKIAELIAHTSGKLSNHE